MSDINRNYSTKTTKAVNDSRAEKPVYNRNSKMRNYEIVFDQKRNKMRAGFYFSKFRGYVPTAEDRYYTVEAGYEHRTDLISHKFYGTAKYDWAIEDANNIQDPIKDITAGKKLIIPSKSKIRFS